MCMILSKQILARDWFIFIIITTLLPNLYALRYPCGCKKIKEKHPEEQKEPQLQSPYLEQYMCGYVKKINYMAIPSVRDVQTVPLSSACLRCGACLAVADKLNETLVVAHETAYWLKKLDDEYVTELLRSLCDHGFENYGLREIDGRRVISEAYSHSNHVATEYDGMWTKKLQELCHYYLDEFGDVKLYSTWLYGGFHPPRDMANTICRNDRVFRDCVNIEDGGMIVSYPELEILRVACP